MKELDPYKSLLKRISNHGYSAYFVGGCVRDVLFGIDVKDVDIATSAPIDIVIDIFSNKTLDTSALVFHTISFRHNRMPVTVTPFRKEGKYTKHRYPSSISHTDSVEEDAKRRDFTINAIYVDIDGKMIDFYNGKEHIKQRRLVSIKTADRSMSEDAIRILRAIRFMALYDLTPDESLAQALKDHASLVNRLSRHSLDSELEKLKRSATYQQQTRFYELIVKYNIKM